jgi:hypothetical protein
MDPLLELLGSLPEPGAEGEFVPIVHGKHDAVIEVVEQFGRYVEPLRLRARTGSTENQQAAPE